MTGRYRKKPVEIEAVQLLMTADEDGMPCFQCQTGGDIPQWMADALAAPKGEAGSAWPDRADKDRYYLAIGTLEGTHWATPGDWIIQGVKGEIYPCKPDIFMMTYEKVDA